MNQAKRRGFTLSEAVDLFRRLQNNQGMDNDPTTCLQCGDQLEADQPGMISRAKEQGHSSTVPLLT